MSTTLTLDELVTDRAVTMCDAATKAINESAGLELEGETRKIALDQADDMAIAAMLTFVKFAAVVDLCRPGASATLIAIARERIPEVRAILDSGVTSRTLVQ